MLQTAKVIRVIMSVVFLIVLLASYAYVPLTLDINIEGFSRIGRDFYFYSALGLFLSLSLIGYFLRQQADSMGMPPMKELMIHLLTPVMFFALALVMGYITVLNNAQDIEPWTYNYLNFLSAALILAWIFTFFLVTIRKI